MSAEELNQTVISNISYYQGPHAVAGIKFRYAGKDLGVSAWGMNILEIEAGCMDYPEHDHTSDMQEEVYVVLKGSGKITVNTNEHALQVGSLVRVGPKEKRKIIPGKDGITVLALGGTPGKAYPIK